MSQEPTTRYQGLPELLADQLRRWQAGDCVPVEDYLRKNPALVDDSPAVLALIFAEVSLRQERGDAPALGEYATRFPQQEPVLRQNWGLLSPGQAGASGRAAPTLPLPRRHVEGAPPALPGYTWGPRLGKGGMGAVYLARQEKLGREVAVKFILAGMDDPQAVARFAAEARAVGKLSHPGVVAVHETGECEGQLYLVMEYLAGGSLKDRLAKGPLDVREAAGLVREVALAVQAVHQAGIVHRDIKPGNILLSPDGKPKVADFGLARHEREGEDLTVSGLAVGTPEYMSPEQARGDSKKAGPAVDVWALGAVLYACLTGRAPFKGASNIDTLCKVCQDEPEPVRKWRPEVPEELEAVCLKCLEKQPGNRYASAGELADDLGRWLAGEPTIYRPPGFLRRAVGWVRRNPRRAFLAAVLAATAAAAGGWWMWGLHSLPAPVEAPDAAGPEGPFEPGVWYELLERAPLREVVKPDGSRTDWWKHDPQKHELWMSSNDWGVLELARVNAEGFDVEMAFDQPRWSGGVALVWGGRDQSALAGPGIWGEFLLLAHFDSSQARNTVPVQKGLLKYLKKSSRFYTERTRAEQLHWPREGGRRFEVTVDRKGTRRVVWDGQAARGRLLGWQDEARGRSASGGIGVMVRKSGVTIQSVRLRVHPSTGEKHD